MILQNFYTLGGENYTFVLRFMQGRNEMKIDRIHSTTNQQTFNANVVKTPILTSTIQYMEEHSTMPDGWHSYKEELHLTKKIIHALKKHPSKENIEIEQTHRYGEMFNARGVISSGKATLIDTEPARSDSIAPILNIMRRIVDPQNKQSFNKLMGEEHAKDYQSWWNKNIKPIWAGINDNFREETCFEGIHDTKFNKLFNSQSGEKRKVTTTMIDGEFVKHYKTQPENGGTDILENFSEPIKKDGKITTFFKKLFS